MEKSVQITLIIAAAIVVVALVGLSIFDQSSPSNTVNVNGQATVKAEPDLVSVYFNVETTGSDAVEAKDKNAEIVDDVLTGLIKLGLERKQITTENFNVYPEYDWTYSSQKLKGYKATHSIRVELASDEIDKAGNVIDAGVDAGALISYMNFELSQEKQNEYKAEALSLATQDAKIKAEAIASGLGKKLGGIVSTSDSSFDYYPWRLYEAVGGSASAESAKAATNIQPGEEEINARVSVIYKLR